MTKNEMVIEILNVHNCLTSKEIANFIWRKFEEIVSPASVSGVLRPMYAAGFIAKGKNLHGSTVYWLAGKDENKVKVNKYM